MIEVDAVEAMIRAKLPQAEILVVDTTGTKDHFNVEVKAAAFVGLSRLKQHQLVQEAVKTAIDAGKIHALSIVTKAIE